MTIIILMFLANYTRSHPDLSNSSMGLLEILVIIFSVSMYSKYAGSKRKKYPKFNKIRDISPKTIINESKDLSLYTNINSLSIPEETYQEYVGRVGEDRIAKELSKLGVGRKIIRNMIIGSDDKTTEIDIILISECGIFVIESKNYNGWIFGDLTQLYWTQTFPNQIKNQFYNPVLQNKGHIKALKLLLEKYPNIEIKSVVVFSDTAIFKKIPESSNDLYILNESEVYTVLDASIDFQTKLKRGPILTPDQIYRIWSFLNQYNIESYRKRNAHLSNIQMRKEKAENKVR